MGETGTSAAVGRQTWRCACVVIVLVIRLDLNGLARRKKGKVVEIGEIADAGKTSCNVSVVSLVLKGV